VCAELPERECGDYTVRVRAEWTGASASASGEFEHLVHLPCDVEPAGRTATVLLTMTTSGLTEAQASTLARNAVGWASPVLRPRVLVVLDDGHHNERPGDAAAVHGWLLDAEAVDRADYLEEPSGGLDAAALEAYDVVWFSNPGYPMDDRASFDALLAFSEAGGGVVLQGDDISWSWANGWSMAPLTRTRWVDNGVRECDQLVNNHRHGQYEVRLAGDPHDLTAGLPATFRYGDDIDYTEPIGDDATVLAWANLPAGACRADRPVLLAHDPGSHP
jgi:hypothetical protein